MSKERLVMPAEWAPHHSVWMAWPYREQDWPGTLAEARAEVTGLCAAIAAELPAESPTGPLPPAETIEMMVATQECERDAAGALSGLPVRLHRLCYADVWLRDTGPIFARSADGVLAAVRFAFNGWGGRYLFEGDIGVAEAVAERSGCASIEVPTVLEGGAVEVDGDGTAITTRQCLLNRNRNPGVEPAAIEDVLRRTLGVEKLLWLERGLAGDHTDGHVDTLVRFTQAGRVVCMRARESDDPNRDVLDEISRDVAGFRDAGGKRLEVVEVPSPGRILDPDGDPLPASYLNFYIGNRSVVVPLYGSRYDDEAVEVLAECFPGREVVGRPARTILTGGGAFHCITQQQPEAGTANDRPKDGE